MALQHNSQILYASPLVTYGAQAGIRLFERWVRDSVGNAGRRATLDEIREGIVAEGRKCVLLPSGWLSWASRASTDILICFNDRFAGNGAAECREKIANNVQGFLKDDCTVRPPSPLRISVKQS